MLCEEPQDPWNALTSNILAVDPNSFIPSFQQVLHGLAVLSTWKYSGRGSLSRSLKKQSVQGLLRAFARLAHVLYTKGIASSLQDAGAGLTSGLDKILRCRTCTV